MLVHYLIEIYVIESVTNDISTVILMYKLLNYTKLETIKHSNYEREPIVS
jgi:hypothetical protein